MSKKVFFIILVLGVIIWFVSALSQGILGTLFDFNPLAGSCQVTGFPFATCTNSYDGLPIAYYLLNIAFWFGIIWVIWKVLQKVLSK